MLRARAFVVTAAASCAAVAAIVPGPAGASGLHAHVASSVGCAPLEQLASTSAVDPSTGVPVTVRNWAQGSNLIVSETLPPEGFSPLTATDAQLSFYGLPLRPLDPSARAAWANQFSGANFTGFVPIAANGLCQSDATAGWTLTSVDTDPTDILPDSADESLGSVTDGQSPNWGGIADNNHSDYNYVDAQYHLDSHTSCSGGNDAHLQWVGLGGDGTTRLMQNGTGRFLNTAGQFPWFEVLNKANPYTATVLTDSAHHVAAGDTMEVSTHWQPGYPRVAFYFHDTTQGWADTFTVRGTQDGGSPDKTVAGHISDYYDGTTAEVIDERPTNKINGIDQYTKLMQHTQSHYTAVSSHGSSSTQAIRYWSHQWLTMKNDAKTTKLEQWDNSPSSHQVFNDNWVHCGQVEPPPATY